MVSVAIQSAIIVCCNYQQGVYCMLLLVMVTDNVDIVLP
ncbi:hypothetical protein BN132_3339 [Cronobacter turicensis 564]|nr:hypothetical protein BN132_3339 [Cronobacter turicensis 564]